MPPTPDAVRRSIEAVWKLESARLIGGLVRLTRDLQSAEDLAHEALVLALERWPEHGIPENPGAWLMTTAKHRGIDRIRQRALHARKQEELGSLSSEFAYVASPEEAGPNVGDDVLRLILMACHPVLPAPARVALTLRLFGGLTTDEIARAFLVPEPTIAQRIVRAKKTLLAAQVAADLPEGTQLLERIPAVLEAIYLIYNEGYTATRGEDWVRPELCQDALRLGRVLAELVPGAGDIHGLVALMELQASRFRSRIGKRGEPVLLMDQNRALWDRLLIQRGFAALARARDSGAPLGTYTQQAAIAACHAPSARPEQTDWPQIAALYDALVELHPSPVVELKRAEAVSRAYGAAAGLELVDALEAQGELNSYQWLPAVRADLLTQLGRHEEARREYERAMTMTENEAERRLLEERARAKPGLN
jgi:RNA polymerase sigma factor (sigma-70 family)